MNKTLLSAVFCNNKIIGVFFLCLMLMSSSIVRSQTFHAIIFADTKDESIGSSCGKDLNNMSILFTNISTATGMQLETIYCSEDECNKEVLFDEIKKMEISVDDVVFFYYTGHGARAIGDKSPFPQLAFNGQSDKSYYPLIKINEKIKQKGPRLLVSMSDACNSIINGLSSKGASSGFSYITKNSSNLYRKLFLETSGNIIITSSEKGENSAALPSGGLASIAFLCILEDCEKQGLNETWQSILDKTKALALEVGKGKQTPYYEIYLKDNIAMNEVVNNTASQPAVNSHPTTNDPLTVSLVRIANDDEDDRYRIDLSKKILNDYFAAPTVTVEIIGRNGTTLLARETANEFLDRISTSYKLTNFTILDKKTNESGKITRLRLHEIYRK